MPGFDHGPAVPAEPDDPAMSARNARYGLILFSIYFTFYAVFVAINAFWPDVMAISVAGVNLAVSYGLGLIAAAIVAELEKLGAPYHAWVLEDLAPRPLRDLPREILDDLENCQVSIFAVQAQTRELRSRIQMTDVVNRKKIRHAHMVNIERRIMLEGMRADFHKVDELSMKVWEIATASIS